MNMLKKTLVIAATAASAAIGFVGTAQAFSFDANGNGTGTFVVGDKTFDNFTCQPSGTTCDNNFVTYQPATGGQYGVTYNPAAALDITDSITTKDVLLGYHVWTTDGALLIHDFLLSSNLSITGGGHLTDNLQICTTQNCATSEIYHQLFAADAGGSLSLPDFVLPGGNYNSLWIFDNVNTTCTVIPCRVEVSSITKAVTQSTPEPTTLALLGLGLAGLGAMRRRKQA